MSLPPLNLTGQVYGRLTVVERSTTKKFAWRCRCACGRETHVQTGSLRNGRTNSCGCGRRDDLMGQTFGRWTVIGPGPTKEKHTTWQCRCTCGQEKFIITSSLKGGGTFSCGCLRDEINRDLHTTHGETDSPEHVVWSGMRDRCLNPNSTIYEYYGGRGITIDPRWDRYENFLEDMGRRPSGGTLERKDNSGPYAPWNCVWESRKAQARNKRTNRVVVYEGRSMCVAELAELKGMNYFMLYNRLVTMGLSVEEAVGEGRIKRSDTGGKHQKRIAS